MARSAGPSLEKPKRADKLNKNGGSGLSDPSPATGKATGTQNALPMGMWNRYPLIGLLAALALTGCGTGEITMTAWPDVPDAGPSELLADGGAMETAGEFFASEVRTVFQPCTSCHQGGSYNRPFLDGWPDVQENFFGPQAQHLVDLENPESSALLSQPADHPVIWYADGQQDIVAHWIELESQEREPMAPVVLETECYPIPEAPTLDEGVETSVRPVFIELGSRFGTGDGSRLVINTSRTRAFLTLTGLRFYADAPGLRIAKPTLIVELPTGDPIVDESSFSHISSLIVEPGTDRSLSEDSVVSMFVPADAEGACLKVRFEEIGPQVGGGGGETMPTTPAIPAADLCGGEPLERFSAGLGSFLGETCAGCHGGGRAAATMAFDLTSVSGSDPASTCDVVRGRVNPASPLDSALLGYFDPAGARTHTALRLGADDYARLLVGVTEWLGE